MKKLTSQLIGIGGAFALLGSVANAGPTPAYTEPYVEPAPISMFAVQPYALYGHTFGSENNADGWGAGISLITPGYIAHNFELGYDWREGNFRDLHTVHAYGRFNLLGDSAGGFSPYVLAGPSYSWGFPESQGAKNTWNLDAGVGASFDLGSAWSVFADYRFRWDLENKLDDSGFVRLGVSFKF